MEKKVTELEGTIADLRNALENVKKEKVGREVLFAHFVSTIMKITQKKPSFCKTITYYMKELHFVSKNTIQSFIEVSFCFGRIEALVASYFVRM